MNNNNMLGKLTEEQRDKMQELISYALIDREQMKVAQLCNANVDDNFLKKICDTILSEKGQSPDCHLEELWLESNPISSDGISYLANFIRKDKKIRVLKLFGNKKDISTNACNELCTALEENTTLTKLVFEFRLQQHRDKCEKLLRRNQNIWREAQKAKANK
ncbi:hypothetical protein RFI_03397 [Reticulomyxa filosa]|uniref:Uncharacterized protein n=1 Tax=Reticulomyxa filosa TaxID=46433 RepID=X6P6J1_RETFI|nr:hypothetical protein RFI_03397 [Reticulomyxa filosa]|eukprot:ETO33704.1 hypothetical protein RFI_03397 [Reticulomyxa filosa]